MLVRVALPPGQYGSGTVYQAGGRWARSNLVRWFEKTLRPMGGWAEYGSTTVTGVARAMRTWSGNDGTPWLAVGTHLGLFVTSSAGAVLDITPAGLTAGIADATSVGGYGSGLYGAGLYGTPRPDNGTIQPVTVWSLDVRGQTLIATNNSDGKIYAWEAGFAGIATQLADSPETARAAVVTEEGFVMALLDDRLVAWSDQIDIEDWTPNAGVNQAGSSSIETAGTLMCGLLVTGGTLIFTDTDAYLATYINEVSLYGFRRVADDGVVSQGAAISTGSSRAVWMGNDGFWAFDGFTSRVPCDVEDLVFGDFNSTQKSKVTSYHDPKYNEVWWFYPSQGSTENDSYALFNYGEGHWAQGRLARTCATKRGGAFGRPFMVDPAGRILQHEFGFDHEGEAIYAETGPIEIGDGDYVVTVLNVIPDERDLGNITRTFYAAQSPTGAEAVFGPYASANPINTRMQGRQLRMRVQFADLLDGRHGIDRLDVQPGGQRR